MADKQQGTDRDAGTDSRTPAFVPAVRFPRDRAKITKLRFRPISARRYEPLVAASPTGSVKARRRRPGFVGMVRSDHDLAARAKDIARGKDTRSRAQ